MNIEKRLTDMTTTIFVEIIDKKYFEGDWSINSNNLTRAVR
jgi:hypothetical protein